jgi:hypothetical protein
MFLLVNPEYKVKKNDTEYKPKIFGFRVNKDVLHKSDNE